MHRPLRNGRGDGAGASDVERAYRLGELLMKRTVLMKDWAQYCNTPASIGNVIPMAQKKGAT